MAGPISRHRPPTNRGPRRSDRHRSVQRSLAPARSRDFVLETLRILQGNRLRLRPLAATGLRRCVKWFSDLQIIHFLGRNWPVTLAEGARWFRDYATRSDEEIFAIEFHDGRVG